MSEFEHILFAPEKDSGISPARVEGLARALHTAGGNPRVLQNSFATDYPQDLFILLGSYAFYPSRSGNMNYKRARFAPIIEENYIMSDLDTDADWSNEGGNIVADDERTFFLAGHNRTLVHDDAELYQTVNKMRVKTDYESIIVDQTSPHLDCCVGLMPNGQFLIKLDETKEFPGDNFLLTGGVTDDGLDLLSQHFGRENLCTFSFSKNSNSDFSLGADMLDRVDVAKPLSMLTNFTTVGNTIIGETFPDDLSRHIHERGMAAIAPTAVGLKTFLPRMEGFVGGAHCSSLKIRNIFTSCHRPRQGQDLKGPPCDAD